MSIAFSITYYFAAIVLLVGLLWKVISYARIPSRYLLPVAPVPRTRFGVVVRITREALFFESLFHASKWTWLFGWIFHYALALVLLRHLYFVTDPVWTWIVWTFVPGDFAAWGMLIGLGGLFGRRIFVDRIRYISSPSDYAMLILLILIAVTGLLLRYKIHVDIFGVREFMLGLINLSPTILPQNVVLYLHLTGVAILVLIFPFSKLIHFPAYFFSPSHNQHYPPRKHVVDE